MRERCHPYSSLPKNSGRSKSHVGKFRSNRSSARDDSTSTPAVPAAFGRASSWREIFEIAPPPRFVTTRTSAYTAAPPCSRPSHGPACKHSCEWHYGGCRRAANQSPRGLWPGRRRTAPARHSLPPTILQRASTVSKLLLCQHQTHRLACPTLSALR